MKKMKRIISAALTLALAAGMALPAFAEGEKGEANITPQTTMKELRENPSIKGSGLYTYVYVWERDCGFLQNRKRTLRRKIANNLTFYTPNAS